MIESILRMRKTWAEIRGLTDAQAIALVQVHAWSPLISSERYEEAYNKMKELLRVAEEEVPDESVGDDSDIEEIAQVGPGGSMPPDLADPSVASVGEQPTEMPRAAQGVQAVGEQPMDEGQADPILLQLQQAKVREALKKALPGLRKVTEEVVDQQKAGSPQPTPVEAPILVDAATSPVKLVNMEEQQVEERIVRGIYSMRQRLGPEEFAKLTTTVKADVEMIQMDTERVSLVDIINLGREPRNPQRLATVRYTPEAFIYINPVMNASQRTPEEMAKTPSATTDMYERFMSKKTGTLRAISEGLHQFVKGVELVLDSEYYEATPSKPLKSRQLVNALQ